jgi:hypothetical protein
VGEDETSLGETLPGITTLPAIRDHNTTRDPGSQHYPRSGITSSAESPSDFLFWIFSHLNLVHIIWFCFHDLSHILMRHSVYQAKGQIANIVNCQGCVLDNCCPGTALIIISTAPRGVGTLIKCASTGLL